jgi:AcrR family transcriptional regulator
MGGGVYGDLTASHFHVSVTDMKTRAYRMTARADATARTATRILDATEALFFEDPARDATLDEIAGRAGVSVQTVIRRFGSRDELVGVAAERAIARVSAHRDSAPPGDLDRALAVLVEHYETGNGDLALRMLADEARNPRLAEIVRRGREYHVAWCERVFAPALAGLRGAARERRLAQLVAVCDVHTWKLLRRDRGLGRAQTQLAMRELLGPLAKES